MDTKQEKINVRPVGGMDDFWKGRAFLVDTYPFVPPDFNWDIRTWETKWFWGKGRMNDPAWRKMNLMWETENGSLIGMLTPFEVGEFNLQVHPAYRDLIEEEMIIRAEELAEEGFKGSEPIELKIPAFEYDHQRHAHLERHSYERTTDHWVLRGMCVGKGPTPPPDVPNGYHLRGLYPDDDSEFERLAILLMAAFNRPYHAADYIHFARYAPCFQHDLHLVIEAGDGSFASFVGVIYDKANQRALYEPVCTHPDHQRSGLASALMLEGMRRAQRLGANVISVETGGTNPANQFYNAVGFTERYVATFWRKFIS